MNRNEIPTKTTDLRKFAKALGLKGLSSANKATLLPAIEAEFDRREAAEKPAPKKNRKPQSRAASTGGTCEVCKIAKVNRKTQGSDSTMCTVCFEEAGIENEHQDGEHEAGTHFGCPMCFPVEVPEGPRTTTSYRFAVAALRRGWKVEIFANVGSDAFRVVATKDGEEIALTWRAGAFQYYTKESFRTREGKKSLILNASQAHRYL